MFQTPIAEMICNELKVPTIGATTSGDEINTIVAAGRADICAIRRSHLVVGDLGSLSRISRRNSTFLQLAKHMHNMYLL